MGNLTETFHDGGFLVSEANGHRSREAITVLSGENLEAGTVIAKVDRGSASATAGGSNTGDGVMGAITVGAEAVPGDYVLTIVEAATNAGQFELKDPDGKVVGVGNVAAAFSGGGLSFTLADGSADFVVGDTFTITVAAGSGKYVQLDTTGVDGSEDAAGILYGNVDASDADKPGVAIVRDAEVNSEELVWPDGISADDKNAAIAKLNELGIFIR